MNDEFFGDIVIGDTLRNEVLKVKALKKRAILLQIMDYLTSTDETICILYGLRRTGKTTLMKQAILELGEENLPYIAYMHLEPRLNWLTLKTKIKELQNANIKYLFIDEITCVHEFTDCASFLSDILAAQGLRLVVTGRESLGLWIADRSQLYDHTYFIHTSYIPYPEWSELTGILDIDTYMKIGSVLSKNVFADKEAAQKYFLTIVDNITNSLAHFENGKHFKSLEQIYLNNDLTKAFNRVLLDENHKVLHIIIEKMFVDEDINLAINDINQSSQESDKINLNKIYQDLMKTIEVQNTWNGAYPLTDNAISEISEYLEVLDFMKPAMVKILRTNGDLENLDFDTCSNLLTQPGLRLAHMDVLLDILKTNKNFINLDPNLKKELVQQIQNSIAGHLLEEIVSLETLYAFKGQNIEVFKLLLPEFSEIDLVVLDNDANICSIYEIKHSSEAKEYYATQMHNDKNLELIESSIGKLVNKNVLYRGTNTIVDDIAYLNVESFLQDLYNDPYKTVFALD